MVCEVGFAWFLDSFGRASSKMWTFMVCSRILNSQSIISKVPCITLRVGHVEGEIQSLIFSKVATICESLL